MEYEKIIRFVRDNPSYEVVRDDDERLELVFYTPSMFEAAEVNEPGPDDTGSIMRLMFTKRGGLVSLSEAWVERPGGRKKLELSEFDVWLEYIGSY